MCCEERRSELFGVDTLSDEDQMRYYDPNEGNPTANTPKESIILAKLPAADNAEAQHDVQVAKNLHFARAPKLHYNLVDPQEHFDTKRDLLAYLQRRRPPITWIIIEENYCILNINIFDITSKNFF